MKNLVLLIILSLALVRCANGPTSENAIDDNQIYSVIGKDQDILAVAEALSGNKDITNGSLSADEIAYLNDARIKITLDNGDFVEYVILNVNSGNVKKTSFDKYGNALKVEETLLDEREFWAPIIILRMRKLQTGSLIYNIENIKFKMIRKDGNNAVIQFIKPRTPGERIP